MKKWLLFIGGAVVLAATFLLIYLTPNVILKAVCPKRYVLNCLVKTVGILGDEYSAGRPDGQSGGTHLIFSMNGTDHIEKQELLKLDAYSDETKLLLSLPQIAGDGYYGAFKGTDMLKKYLTYSKVYNKCFDIQATGKKYFGIMDLKLLVEKTSEYTLTFDQKGMRETAELFLKTSFSQEERAGAREKIYKLLDGMDPGTVIRLHMDNRNRVVSIRCEIQKEESDVFVEMLFKNDKVLINDMELLYYKKSQLDNLIVSIKSEGNHKLVDGAFDDNTTITVVSSYVQLAKLKLTTKVEPSGQGGCFAANAEGKVLMLPVRLSAAGNCNDSEGELFYKSAWTLSISDHNGEILRRQFDTALQKTALAEAPKAEFSAFFDVNETQKDTMVSRLAGVFQHYFIQDLLDAMGKD